jgi:hypothetical protein
MKIILIYQGVSGGARAPKIVLFIKELGYPRAPDFSFKIKELALIPMPRSRSHVFAALIPSLAHFGVGIFILSGNAHSVPIFAFGFGLFFGVAVCVVCAKIHCVNLGSFMIPHSINSEPIIPRAAPSAKLPLPSMMPTPAIVKPNPIPSRIMLPLPAMLPSIARLWLLAFQPPLDPSQPRRLP